MVKPFLKETKKEPYLIIDPYDTLNNPASDVKQYYVKEPQNSSTDDTTSLID